MRQVWISRTLFKLFDLKCWAIGWHAGGHRLDKFKIKIQGFLLRKSNLNGATSGLRVLSTNAFEYGNLLNDSR